MSNSSPWIGEPQPHQQKRAILLLRVSDAKQLRKDVTIPAQRAAGHQKAKELGAIVTKEFIEPGYSGRDIAKRPIFRDMIARIKDGQDIDYVIVYAYSRFARNVYDHSVMKVTLEKLGVKVVSATENIQGDKPSDRAMENMIAVFNEFRSLVDGEDIKYKMSEKVKNGGTNGQAPLGYLNAAVKDGDGKRTVIHEPERKDLIRLAFELYATGRYTLDTLHDKMVELGLRTRGNKRFSARPVCRSKLGHILRDRYYIGYVKWNGLEYPGKHEPLISLDLFERVQRVMDAQTGAGTRNRRHNHFLKGLLWCYCCGRRLIVIPGKGNGGQYFYFLCRGRQEHECDLPYLRMPDVEQAVHQHYTTVVFSDDFRAEVVANLDQALTDDLAATAHERQQLTGRLTELETKEEQYFALVGNPAWSQSKLSAKMAEVQQERDRVVAALDQLDNELDLARDIFLTALELLRNPYELYARLEAPERRLLTQLLFTKLKVDEQGAIADDELNEPFDSIVMAGRTYEAAQRQAEEPADKLEEQTPGEGRSEGSDRPEDDTGFGTAMWQSLAVVAGQEGETTNGTSRTGGAIETVGGSPDGLSPTPLLDLVPCGHSGSSKGVVVRVQRLEPVHVEVMQNITDPILTGESHRAICGTSIA